MSKILFKCLVFYSVFILHVNSISGYIAKSRYKREPVPEPADSTVAQKKDVCASYNAVMPDYNRYKLRTSEKKCYEYIWQLKNLTDKNNWDKKCVPPKASFVDKIIGGRNALVSEFPHMVGIGWQGDGKISIKCGGSLISSRFVLTAAHCSKLSALDGDPKIARFRDRNILELEELVDIPIIRIILHPNYTAPIKYNDIGLLELDRDMAFTKNIHPACLWVDKKYDYFGSEMTITGWGVIDTNAKTQTSNKLKAAVVDLIDNKTCTELLSPLCNPLWCGVQKQICAGKLSGGVDTCQGDSGGPLQVKVPLPRTTQGFIYYVVGITQFGLGCAIPNTPGIYTQVASYIDWIESIVWRK